eukprot:scaffold211591_cov18-Tisochrysis_lutea.AAC.2
MSAVGDGQQGASLKSGLDRGLDNAAGIIDAAGVVSGTGGGAGSVGSRGGNAGVGGGLILSGKGRLSKEEENAALVVGGLKALDTVVWQMLASVMIPGKAARRVHTRMTAQDMEHVLRTHTTSPECAPGHSQRGGRRAWAHTHNTCTTHIQGRARTHTYTQIHTYTHTRHAQHTGFIIHQSVHLATHSLSSPAGLKTLTLGANAFGRVVGMDLSATLPGYVSAVCWKCCVLERCWGMDLSANCWALVHSVGMDLLATLPGFGNAACFQCWALAYSVSTNLSAALPGYVSAVGLKCCGLYQREDEEMMLSEGRAWQAFG